MASLTPTIYQFLRSIFFRTAVFGLLINVSASGASCPVTRVGQPIPAQATGAPVDDVPTWRPRVDQIETELSNADLPHVKILFLGDSIVERWDPEIFERHFGAMGTLKLGVGRDTTRGLLWRLPRMQLGAALQPNLVVLLIGANDTFPGANAEAVAIGIGEIVRTIRNLSPTSHILLLGLLPRGAAPDDLWRQVGTQINVLISACADDKMIFYADPGRVLSPAGSGVSKSVEEDYLHPTPLGYGMLSDALDAEIKQVLKP